MSEERWRSVLEFEGVYEVSDLGRVKRVRAGQGCRPGRILRDAENGHGYRVVSLWRENRGHMRLVHVLVAGAFLGLKPDGMDVNHKDGNKANNAASNLEYLTRSGNNEHAYRTGLRSVTALQLARLRSKHKPRQPRTVVACACGCGAQFETPDKHGRERRFKAGHNNYARKTA